MVACTDGSVTWPSQVIWKQCVPTEARSGRESSETMFTSFSPNASSRSTSVPLRSMAGVTTNVVLSSPVGGATSRLTTMKRVLRSGRSSMPTATVTSSNCSATRVGAMATSPSSPAPATRRQASACESA